MCYRQALPKRRPVHHAVRAGIRRADVFHLPQSLARPIEPIEVIAEIDSLTDDVVVGDGRIVQHCLLRMKLERAPDR